MPSSKLRDDLPSYVRAGILAKLADVVIHGVGRLQRTGSARRRQPTPTPKVTTVNPAWEAATHGDRLEPEIVEAEVVDESPTAQPRAISAGSRTTADSFRQADEVRERLRQQRKREEKRLSDQRRSSLLSAQKTTPPSRRR